MASGGNWPDPANPGFPDYPDDDGPHVLLTPDGWRTWGWWGHAIKAWSLPDNFGAAPVPPGLAAEELTYIGPAKAPDERPVPLSTQNLSRWRTLG